MEDVPSQREIRKTCCTLDGKNKERENLLDCPDHYFIVVTRRSYNQRSQSFLGVPLSSMKGDETDKFRLNYGGVLFLQLYFLLL